MASLAATSPISWSARPARKGSVPAGPSHTRPSCREQHPTASPEGVSAPLKAAGRATRELGDEMALLVSLPRGSGGAVTATGRRAGQGAVTQERLVGEEGGAACPSRPAGDLGAVGETAPGHGGAGGSSCVWVAGARARGGPPREGCGGTHKGPGLPARPSRASTTSWGHSPGRTLRPSPWAGLSVAL